MTSRRVFLIGPRGSGKTTVARLLAAHLGWGWVDADVHLEERAGQSIRELFANEGEAGFRRREMDLLAELCDLDYHVIATGGGVILHADNRARLIRSGMTIWLTGDAGTLWQRIDTDATTASRRPALGMGGLEEMVQLLAAREPLYRACATHTVDTTGKTPESITAEVARLLGSG